jgi:hypothetical protein
MLSVMAPCKDETRHEMFYRAEHSSLLDQAQKGFITLVPAQFWVTRLETHEDMSPLHALIACFCSLVQLAMKKGFFKSYI